MRHYTFKFFVCIFIMFSISSFTLPVEARPDDDWQMFGHDAQHTWYTGDSGPSESSLNWSVEGVFRGSPAVVGGKVYISYDTGVRCLDGSTGENIWAYETEWAVESSPAVVGGKVYVGSVDRKLYALDASTGQEVWSFEADGWVNSSPVVADGRVYFTTHVNSLYSLSASNGSELWKRQDIMFRFPPSISGGMAYVGTADSRLLALNAYTGADVWSYSTEGYVVSAPAVSAGKLYFSTNILDGRTIIGSRIYSLDVSSGGELWKVYLSSELGSSPAVKENRLYVGSHDRNLYSLRTSDGEVVWSYEAEGPVFSAPVVAGTKVYFSDGKIIYSLDASTGHLLWKDYYSTISSPVVVGGNMYVTNSSSIYAIGQPQETPSDTEVGLLERPETLLAIAAAVGITLVALYWLMSGRGQRVEKEEPRW